MSTIFGILKQMIFLDWEEACIFFAKVYIDLRVKLEQC
jgi:hypothetical protein